MKKFVLSRNKIVDIWNVLNTVEGNIKKTFSYYSIRNQKALEHEIVSISALEQALVPPPEYIEFENKRNAINKKLCVKDENTNPLIINGEYQHTNASREKFEKQFSKLTDEYKDILIAFDSARNEIMELKSEEIEVELYPIPFSCIPDQFPKPNMEALFDIIEFDE